jgi:hypothetical protein
LHAFAAASTKGKYCGTARAIADHPINPEQVMGEELKKLLRELFTMVRDGACTPDQALEVLENSQRGVVPHLRLDDGTLVPLNRPASQSGAGTP